MPTLSSTTHRLGHVTFVELLVSAERPVRVRIESRLDGDVWPPRTERATPHEWDGSTVVCEMGEGTTPLGFATPAEPRANPVELVSVEPVPYGAVGVPEGVRAWLHRVESRVRRAESLASANDVETATRAVSDAGGLAAVEELAAAVATDRRVANRLSFVPDELLERLQSVSIPVETFGRLTRTAEREP